MSRVDRSLRALGRQTVIYGLSYALSRAAAFVMLPIYTRFLTPADYGVLNLVQMTLDITAILLSAGIVTGVFRFYVKAETDRARSQVVTSAFYLLEVFNLIAAALLFAAAPRIAAIVLDGAESAGLVRIAALAVAFEAFTIVPLLLIQVRQRAGLYLAASSARLVTQIGLNVLFVVVLERGVEGILLSTLLTNLGIGLLCSGWMFRQVGFGTGREAARDLVRFGLPYRVAQAGTFILTFGDRLFLKAFHDLTTIGIYTLAYQFGFLVMYGAAIPFLQAWNPQRFEIAKLSRVERDAQYNRGLRYFALAVVTLSVAICLFVTPVLGVMSDPAFHPAAALVPILVAAYAFQAFTDVVEHGIQRL